MQFGRARAVCGESLVWKPVNLSSCHWAIRGKCWLGSLLAAQLIESPHRAFTAASTVGLTVPSPFAGPLSLLHVRALAELNTFVSSTAASHFSFTACHWPSCRTTQCCRFLRRWRLARRRAPLQLGLCSTHQQGQWDQNWDPFPRRRSRSPVSWRAAGSSNLVKPHCWERL